MMDDILGCNDQKEAMIYSDDNIFLRPRRYVYIMIRNPRYSELW